MKGKVIRFNPKKGFGFIKSDDGKDVFFHYSSLEMDGYKTVEPNTEVDFELLESDKGFKAAHVKVAA